MIQKKFDLTFIEALNLKALGQIRQDRTYYLTDKEIILTGVSPTDFSLDGRAKFTNGIRSKGGFRLLDAGSLVSVDTITVNGVDVLGAPVVYTGDKFAFAQDISNQINTYVSSPDYEAFPVGSWVCISAIATGIADNGATINATYTGAGTLSIRNFAGGVDPYDVRDYVHYDISNDLIILRKSKEDVEISFAATYPSNPIQQFEYRGSPSVYGVRLHNAIINNVWIDNGFLSDITLDNYSAMSNVAVINGGGINNIKGTLTQVIGELYAEGFLQGFDGRNGAFRRIEIGAGGSLNQTFINAGFIYNSTIDASVTGLTFNNSQINRMTITTSTIVQDNTFHNTNINHFLVTDTLSYGPEAIKNIFSGCFIGDFFIDSSSVNNQAYINVSLTAMNHTGTTQSTFNKYENFNSTNSITYDGCSVSRNSFMSLNMIASYSMTGTQLTDNELYNTSFRGNFFSCIITNNRLNCKNNFIGAGGNYFNLLISNHDAGVGYGQVSVEYKDMDGLAGAGQVGTDIILGHLPFIQTIVDEAAILCDALVSATNTAELSFGVDIDDATGISSATVITTLNTPYIPALAFTNPTTDYFRAIIATPTVEDITAGRVRISVDYHYDYN